MQYTSLPDGFTIQELDASHLEQFNALLRYAFQVTEEELVQVGWQEDEIKQSKFPILESAHVLGCFEGKTLAAQIAVYPMQVNVEGSLLDTGFVTGVATRNSTLMVLGATAWVVDKVYRYEVGRLKK